MRLSRLQIVLAFLLSVAGTSWGQRYQQTNLFSDVPGLAPVTNPDLKNPWGVARSSGGPGFVAGNQAGVATTYTGDGLIGPDLVTVPAPPGQPGPSTPTGVVFNGSSGFAVAPGKPASFIFVTEDGTISAWNPNVNGSRAVLKVNNAPHAVYKGAAIAENNGRRFLYAANFHDRRIEVYDSNFQRVRFPGEPFGDGQIPGDFSPFNVQAIGSNLYVAYAKPDSAGRDNVDGAGLGFVDVFDPQGRLLARLEHGPWFNAPWGIALAPSEFGEFSHDLLIGNFGSGMIAAFNPVTGKFLGNILDLNGKILKIDGLWALSFGNNDQAGSVLSLFFTAGINHEKNGLLGMISPATQELFEDDEP